MKLEFSAKQLRAMTWWLPNRKDSQHDIIICDGAVRSGKTLALSLGFFLWAMCCFDGRKFGLCGRTRSGFWRNVLTEVLPWLRKLGVKTEYSQQEHRLTARLGGRENTFYLFGGSDERSAGLIQGITLTGVLLDEVVLMPRSFVEQACARCSADGSRIWFSCNPEGPQHWFYREWILQAKKKNCLYLHFTMEDNPSLSSTVKRRYRQLYSGTFYRRFVLGQWVAAQGRVYEFYDTSKAEDVPDGPFEQWVISCDYGTVNPASFGLWGLCGGVWYRVREFYFDSRKEGYQMTDEEYAHALEALADGKRIREVIVDPSAASFIEVLRRRGFAVRRADNDVLRGIRLTADALKRGKVVICKSCEDCLREMDLYMWDSDSGMDRVKKQNDHAMDDMRYFVMAVCAPRTRLSVCAVSRGT